MFTHVGHFLKGCKHWLKIPLQEQGGSPLPSPNSTGSLAPEVLCGMAAAILADFGQLQSPFLPYAPHYAHL